MLTKVLRVEGVEVISELESWRVVDRWWTKDPYELEYLDLLLADDARIIVIREPGGAWRRGGTF